MLIIANFILMAHFLYVLAVVFPIFLIPLGWKRKWKWVRSRKIRLVHLGMMGFVFFEVLIGMACPLTVLENKFLMAGGKVSYQNDFLAHWVSKIMYWQMPTWVFVAIYALVFGVIILLWRIFPPGRVREAGQVLQRS